LPALQIVPVARFWSPHYVYLPVAFVAMLLAESVERLVKDARRALLVTTSVIVILGAITLYDGRRYESDALLWAPEVLAQPACREGHFYLGEALRLETKPAEAAKHYEAAIAPRPRMLAYVDRGAALQNLGVVRAEQRQFGAARAAFREALSGTGGDEGMRRELTHDLAAASLSDGDPAEAASLLEEETARADALAESILVRAMALDKLGRHDEARVLFDRIKRN
jgi:tetratricopeptide (TPR) repeat protein